MSTNEFREVVHKVLPAEDSYSGKAKESMTLQNISGEWSYFFQKNILESALFESKIYVDYYDSDKEKKPSAKEIFIQRYQNTFLLLTDLIKKYGKPTSQRSDDTTGIIFQPYAYDLIILAAEWKTDEYTIRFNSYYDGIEPNNRYQNNVSGATIENYAFVVNLSVEGKENEYKMHFRLGETAQEMEKRSPENFKNGTSFFGNYSREDKWNELEGNWEFCFKGGKLANAGFNYNYFEDPKEKPMTKKTYDNLISGFRSVQKDLENTFGKPISGSDAIPDYKKIEEHKVSGVDFLKYKWETKNQLIHLSLRYHYGGKGEFYSSMYFDVKITDLEGNYSYCDR